MDFSHPLAVVTPTVDGDVLAVLAGADTDFTASGIHRLLPHYGKRGIDKVLVRLMAQGIVLRTHEGRPGLYRLNRHHLAAGSIIELARQKDRLIELLEQEVSHAPIAVVHAALFGSAARGGHTPTSDIDLLLIHPDGVGEEAWQEFLASLAAHVHRWTGNDARIISFSESEAMASITSDPLLQEVQFDGIPLTGGADWLASARRRARR